MSRSAPPPSRSLSGTCCERGGRNIRFVFRHFPLVEMHPHAEPAAETAEFAGSHGLFWPMHEAIFANQHALNIPLLIALAASLKLSPIELRDALANGRFASKIQADFAERRAQRRQRNTDVLHQWYTARQPLWRRHPCVGDRSGDACRRRVTNAHNRFLGRPRCRQV